MPGARPGYNRDNDDDDGDDNMSALLQCLSDNLDAEVYTYAKGLLAKLVPDSGMATDRRIASGRGHAADSAVREMQAIRAAEAAVRPFVGAMDCNAATSANGIYLSALRHLGHDIRGLDSRAAKAMFNAVKFNDVRQRMAADGTDEAAMRARFPGIAALKRR